jgi:hypothetical protein
MNRENDTDAPIRRLNPVTLMAGACALVVLVLWVVSLVQ